MKLTSTIEWGENHQHHDGEETIIKMSFPRVFIRYVLADAYFATYEEFYNSIAEVQWFDGDDVSDKQKRDIDRSLEFFSYRRTIVGRRHARYR